jgi:hypothetical protein
VRVLRTLGTQFRLRRLIRLQAEQASRLAGQADRRTARTASLRLLSAARDLRAAVQSDLAAAGFELPELRRHLNRSLAAMEVTLARMGTPGADFGRLTLEFREVALPLLFLLRGLEGCTEEALGAWMAPEPLRRTA